MTISISSYLNVKVMASNFLKSLKVSTLVIISLILIGVYQLINWIVLFVQWVLSLIH